jgi:hypothetical protein
MLVGIEADLSSVFDTFTTVVPEIEYGYFI